MPVSLPTAPPTSLPSTTPPVSTAGGVLTRTAHVSFEHCGSKYVTLSVSIAKDPFPIGEPVTYSVRLTNSGSVACGPRLHDLPPLQRGLGVGPCGALSAVVSNAFGHNVYPGPQVFFCPDYVGTGLGAHSSLSAVGTWTGYEALSDGPGPLGTVQWQKAPPGRYHVTIDGAVSVPFELAGTPVGAPPAPAPLP
jgi:hypothetical protein